MLAERMAAGQLREKEEEVHEAHKKVAAVRQSDPEEGGSAD
jgi:hypothetical protein